MPTRSFPPHDGEVSGTAASRRHFLLTSAALFMAGCARQTAIDEGAVWESPALPNDGGFEPFATPPAPSTTHVAKTTTPGPTVAPPSPRIVAPNGPAVISRSTWATGAPVPRLMNTMKPVRYITVHHDGMRPFFGSNAAAASQRLDAIRRSHRGSQWGDIGYHFAIDRAGNVFEARPIRYQGAHVKNHNVGNIGIVCLGNFERQHPTDAQAEALRRHVATLQVVFRVPARNVRTHREWAATACPGRELQKYVDATRGRGGFA